MWALHVRHGILKAESRSPQCVWTGAEERAVIAAFNKHDCDAEGKFSIFSAYFHYRYLVLQNKHMGTSVYTHPQMGCGKQRKRERALSLHMCLYLYICIYLFQERQCILSPPNGSSAAHVKQAGRAKVPKYVGQKNWSVLNLSSNQILTVPGTELPIACARTWNVRSEDFRVPSSSRRLGWGRSVDLWSGNIWKKWLGFF